MPDTHDEKQARISSPAAALPADVLVLVAKNFGLNTLLAAFQVNKHWKGVIIEADTQLWATHARQLLEPSLGPNTDESTSFDALLTRKRQRCYNRKQWDKIKTWQDLVRQILYLNRFFSGRAPEVRSEILCRFQEEPGSDGSVKQPPPRPKPSRDVQPVEVILTDKARHVEIGRLDTAEDADFLVQIERNAGLQVVDTKDGPTFGGLLFKFACNGEVRHLEYHDGIACLEDADGIKILKRWKLVYGFETEEQRGHFVLVMTTQGSRDRLCFKLNEQHHLASRVDNIMVSSVETDAAIPLHNIAGEVIIDQRVDEFIDHNEHILVFSTRYTGYHFFEKQSGASLGTFQLDRRLRSAFEDRCNFAAWFTFDPRLGTRFEYDEEGRNCAWSEHNTRTYSFATLADRRPGPIEDHRFYDLPIGARWDRGILTTLNDSSIRFVAKTQCGRLFVCTDILGLLAALDTGDQATINAKIRLCTSFLDHFPGTALQASSGLAVQNDRAAFQLNEYICVVPLPRKRDTLLCAGASCMIVCAEYAMGQPSPWLSSPVLSISMHDDVIVSTVLHPVFAQDSSKSGDKWRATYAKSIRVFGPVYFDQNSSSTLRSAQNVVRCELQMEPLHGINALREQWKHHLRCFKRELWNRHVNDPWPLSRQTHALKCLRSAQEEIVAFLTAHPRYGHGADYDAQERVIQRITLTLADTKYNDMLDILGYKLLPPLSLQGYRPDLPSIEELIPLTEMNFDVDLSSDAFW